jgi:hypothetical protein
MTVHSADSCIIILYPSNIVWWFFYFLLMRYVLFVVSLGLDRFRKHTAHCRELSSFKYIHDFVRKVLLDVFKHAWVSVKKEASVNFLTDPLEGRSTFRGDCIRTKPKVKPQTELIQTENRMHLVWMNLGDFLGEPCGSVRFAVFRENRTELQHLTKFFNF